MKRSVYWVIIALILVVSVGMRIYQFGSIPVSVYWDEAAILADARSIAATGQDIHGNSWLQAMYPSYGDYKLPVLIWLVSLAVQIFGASELAVRSIGFLAGLGTLAIAVALVRELASLVRTHKQDELALQKLTIAALVVVGTSFWAIHFSRVAFEGYLAQFLVGLSVLVALKARKWPLLFVLSALIGATAVYTYYSVRFVWPVVFTGASLLPLLLEQVNGSKKQRIWEELANFIRSKRSTVFTMGLSLLLFGLVLLPLVRSPYYAASQQFRLSSDSILLREPQVREANALRELSGNTIIDRIFFHRDLLTVKLLAEHYAEHLSINFLFLTGDRNLRHGTGTFGLFPLVMIVPLLLGCYMLARQQRGVLVLLIGWWLISLLPASVPYDVPHALRSLNALLPMSIIMAFGILPLLQLNTWVQRGVLATVAVILAFQVMQFWQYYTVIYPRASAVAWQSGYHELASALYQRKDQYQQIWVELGDKRINLWLLAYPYYPADQLATFPKQSFEVTQIETIHFGQYDLKTHSPAVGKVLVVNERDALAGQLATTEVKPASIEYVTDSTGQVTYALASFE